MVMNPYGKKVKTNKSPKNKKQIHELCIKSVSQTYFQASLSFLFGNAQKIFRIKTPTKLNNLSKSFSAKESNLSIDEPGIWKTRS